MKALVVGMERLGLEKDWTSQHMWLQRREKSISMTPRFLTPMVAGQTVVQPIKMGNQETIRNEILWGIMSLHSQQASV